MDWITSERRYPGEPRFTSIKTVLKVENRTEHADKCTRDTRFFISSAPLDIERLARAARGHWGVESMHWLLDCEFAEDLSRYRSGHCAKNMAVVRRFALGLVRANKRVNLDSVPCPARESPNVSSSLNCPYARPCQSKSGL